MATNQTQHYGLNQWELSDSVVMEEFNEDNRKIDAALHNILSAIPRIHAGTYTGTGTYGADNPNTLTFEFAPKLVFINCVLEGGEGANGNDHYIMIAVHGTPKTYITYWSGSSCATVNLLWGDTSLSWYGSSAQKQGNWKNAVYRYIAIG